MSSRVGPSRTGALPPSIKPETKAPARAASVNAATPPATTFKPGLVNLSPSDAPASRPEAPWSAQAKVMANEAIAAATRAGLTGDAAIKKAVEVLSQAPIAKDAKLSVNISEIGKTPRAITRGNADVDLNPASNSKLATASYALARLGNDFVFETPLRMDAGGNLYVQGSFDPSITAERLAEAAKALAASGVKSVGNVVIDNSRLEGSRTPSQFDKAGDSDYEFLARPEAFSVDKNLVEVTIRPGEHAGDAAQVSLDDTAFAVDSEVHTTDAGAQFKIGVDERDVHGTLVRNDRGQGVIQVWGDIAQDYLKGKVLKMKSPDVNATSSDKLLTALRTAGIQVKGSTSVGVTPSEAKTVFTMKSAPLKDLLRESIAQSNAFDHEMYALAASAHESKDGRTSLDNGLRGISGFLKDEVGLADFRMRNASGIGNANRLSANDMVELVNRAATDPRFHAIAEGLARPGLAGSTLATRMLNTPAETRLSAKTGTLTGIIALSGIVQAQDGRQLAFSSLLNGLPKGAPGREGGRAFVDALGIVLASLK